MNMLLITLLPMTAEKNKNKFVANNKSTQASSIAEYACVFFMMLSVDRNELLGLFGAACGVDIVVIIRHSYVAV